MSDDSKEKSYGLIETEPVNLVAEYNLAINTFDTKSKDEITISDTAKTLPNMQGSGNVRELQQAATQSTAVQSLLTQFAQTITRTAQRALLDNILNAWVDTGKDSELSKLA